MRFTGQDEQDAHEFGYVTRSVPHGTTYEHRVTGSIWYPVNVAANIEGDLVTAYEVPQSHQWTYRVINDAGAISIFPEGQALHMYLGDFLTCFEAIEESVSPDYDEDQF